MNHTILIGVTAYYPCHRPIILIISFCFQQHYVTNCEVTSWFAPFWLCLKWSKEFLVPSASKFICDVLNSSPSSSDVEIWCSKRSRRWHFNFWLHYQQIWRWNDSFNCTICNVLMVIGLEFAPSTSIIKFFKDCII